MKIFGTKKTGYKTKQIESFTSLNVNFFEKLSRFWPEGNKQNQTISRQQRM